MSAWNKATTICRKAMEFAIQEAAKPHRYYFIVKHTNAPTTVIQQRSPIRSVLWHLACNQPEHKSQSKSHYLQDCTVGDRRTAGTTL